MRLGSLWLRSGKIVGFISAAEPEYSQGIKAGDSNVHHRGPHSAARLIAA
jgi:hypothetical protein